MGSEALEANWGNEFKKKSEKSESTNIGWLTMEPGTYQIRLVGSFVKFYRWWQPFNKQFIADYNFKDQDKAWQAGFYPRRTYAIHVLDRGDKTHMESGTLKILEKGSSIFEHFANFATANNKEPGGKDSHDFTITVEWPKGNKRQAKYSVAPVIAPSPLTQEELDFCKANFVDLRKRYKANDVADINAAWDALPPEKKVVPVRDGDGNVVTQAAATPAPAPQPVVADGDDLFDDGPAF